MTILITGVAGYIGSHTALQAINSGHTVIGVDDLSKGSQKNIEVLNSTAPGKFRFLEQDFGLLNERDLSGVDAVVHFAAFKSVPESVQEPARYYKNNYLKTRLLVNTVGKSQVKHFVFSSTSAVYVSAESALTEDSSTVPVSPYGASKLAAEDALARILPGINTYMLRYFNVAGMNTDSGLVFPGKPEALLPQVINRYVNGQSAQVFGGDYDTKDGSCIRDFIHVEDLARAHLLALEVPAKMPTVINLGSGNGFSVLEVMQKIKEIVPDFEYSVAPRREGDIVVSFCSPDFAARHLGWKPVLSLTDMIQSELKYQHSLAATDKSS